MNAVAVISPGWPDLPGGVTDHTSRLVEAWRRESVDVDVLGAIDQPVAAVVRAIEARGAGALLLQYVPFLYGRRGLAPFPVLLLEEARRRGMRSTLFVHEPWVPPTRLPWLVLSPLQRRRLRQLARLADAVVTPVPAWRDRIGATARVVHVGSTLGAPPPDLPPEPALAAPVVFSPFAAGLSWDAIVAAADSVSTLPRLIVIGASVDDARRHPAVTRWLTHDQEWRGRLPADEALRLLARARLVLAPFVDGLTGRRTSAMAALSAGARVLALDGPLTDPLFARGPATLARGIDEFGVRARELWTAADPPAARDRRLRWYRDHLDPHDLDLQLLAIVRGTA